MSFEVELKFPVAEVGDLEHRIEKLGAVFVRHARQVDTYFAHPVRNFAETDEAFRVRRDEDSNCLTYKGPIVDAHSKTRHEIEVGLTSGESVFQKTLEMCQCLGFRIAGQVEKRRSEYKLLYRGESVMLMLDDVLGLGKFVEIETIAEDADRDSARDRLWEIATGLGLSDDVRNSYLSMLLRPDSLSGKSEFSRPEM